MKTCFALLFTLLLSTQTLFAQSLSSSFNYPFYAESESTPENPNNLRILNSGIASLQLRLNMIERAQKSIELEYFIFQNDMSGRLLITELIKKAEQGVKVRILIDKSITVIRFDEYYAAEVMRHPNIKIAYYNRALDPATAQFRNHRKLLSIDEKEAITGGRNIGLDYFDLDPNYNFFDRDVWVEGPIVRAMVDSFDKFWSSTRTKVAKLPKVPEFSRLHRSQDRRNTVKLRVHERRKKEAADFVSVDLDLERFKQRVQQTAQRFLDLTPKHTCPRVTFVSDRPGATIIGALSSDYRTEDRILNQVLKQKMREAHSSVVMESPYFMVNDSFGDFLNDMLNQNKEVSILTNSLGSTDAIYVSANFYRQAPKWIDRGLDVYVFNSTWHAEETTDVITPRIKDVRYGIHSKTFVIDDDSFTIGTYNVDNRSDFYNTEMSLFCEGSSELSQILIDNINLRVQNSSRLISEEHALTHNGLAADAYGGATDELIKWMKRIEIPSRIFEFLM